MPRKQPKSLASWLIPRLRRISMWWPSKSIARDRDKVKLKVGVTKKGKPIYRTFWQCAKCLEEGNKSYYKRDETNMDHITPVIRLDGHKDWNETLDRLFCNPEGYQTLCLHHHEQKTGEENKKRKAIKKLTKKGK